MIVKLKTRIALGGIFLFTLLILVGAVSFFYLNNISEKAKDIVKDNYETLNYSREMLRTLDNIRHDSGALRLFKKNLLLQEKNITEPEEKELTSSLRKNFNALEPSINYDSLEKLIRQNISGIMELNLKAINNKNQSASQSADKAKLIITIILTLCILAGLTFIFNFPSLVASPIASLTKGIKAIANKDYRQRIHLNRKDEFGELANAFNIMAEKLDEYEHSSLATILFEKQRAETVINVLKDASIGIDNSGNILFINQQALQLLNLKETDVAGLKQEQLAKSNDLFRFLLNEKNNTPFKIVVEDKENYFTKEIVDITRQNQKSGVIIVLKNITPFKEIDTAKTNFIATISHELKTPLASSDFSLKLLEDERNGTLTPEQLHLVSNLKEDNRRMLRILSELLDLSQVESGKLQLVITPIAVYDIIKRAQASVSNVLKEKNITLKVQADEQLPLVNADAEKSSWILNNFLTNAIKYTPENGEIILKTITGDEYIEIGVQDAGIGIEENFQSKIFDRYFKIPGNTTKKGSGLGLAISKDFAEAMGGTIGVSSQIGKGSYFYFRLLKS